MFAVLILLLAAPREVEAQLRPDLDWRSLSTEHFRVHFTPPLEPLARRAAAEAERAFDGLSKELHPPRTPIDVVVSDDADFANGWATPLPTNRVVIYADPPIDAGALRHNDDWLQLVVTHELAHIFHIDRSRGIWALAQHVFGRAPLLFPNLFSPAWLTEGLAVYYETRLTGSGRLAGTEHRMIARSAAAAGHFPRLDEVSLGTPRFPGGNVVYAYGSLFVQYLADRGGEGAVRSLVERSSAQLLPIVLTSSKNAFGVGFSQAWRDWRDSLVRNTDPALAGPPLPGWRDLTPEGFLASYPRWAGDSAVLYVGATPREPYGAWRARLDGTRERLGRRNSRSPQVPLRDDGVLYSQLDFTNPYQVRADLYVQRDGREHRLTRGARLIMPDARASDGEIVAVEIAPGATSLALFAADGTRRRALKEGSVDEQWSEPRWSPDGRSLAAVHWRRGLTSIAVIDVATGATQSLGGGYAVLATPSWSPDGRTIYYVTDVFGRPTLMSAQVGSASFALSGAGAPVVEASLSPSGDRVAVTAFEWDGYHVGVAPLPAGPIVNAMRAEPPEGERVHAASAPSVVAQSRGYSALRTLLPRYWLPIVEDGAAGGTRLGAFTSGNDVIGRHQYFAQLAVPTSNQAGGITGGIAYGYAGLGQPFLSGSAFQDWESRGGIFNRDRTLRVGTLLRRTQDASLAATWRRPRYRTNASVSGGVGYERRLFATTPDSLLERINPAFTGDTAYPRLFVSGAFGNAYRTGYGISPENGIGLTGTVLQRWAHGTSGPATRTYLGVATGYRALPLPGFANHVIATRLAGGWSDSHATRALEVGGTSGAPIALIPGVSLGEGSRTFPVRGFPLAALFGTRAATASLEYRAPLWLPARGWKLLPLFVDRTAISLFGDYGTAGCGPYIATACPAADSLGGTMRSIASVGAELNVNAAVLNWDQPYRFRFGVAVPVKGREETAAKSASVYLTTGLSF